MNEIIFKRLTINNSTGEVIDEEYLNTTSHEKITKKIVKSILEDETVDSEYKISKIKQYLFSCKLLNPKNSSQIRLFNNYNYEKKINKAIEEIINISKYIIRLTNIADSFNNCLKINRQTPCESWEDIYKTIGLTNKISRQTFKNFCEKYSIVRKARFGNNNGVNWTRFYLNPCFRKSSDYITDYTLYVFHDIIEELKNINEFAIDLLKLKYE